VVTYRVSQGPMLCRRNPPETVCTEGRPGRGLAVRPRLLAGGSDGSRRRILRRVARLLTVVAFTRRVPVRHGDHLEGTFRRPLTSCAHRLRKPDRTYELLALSVARWTRRCGLRPAATSTPKGGLRITTAPSRDAMSGHLPPRQAGRCRRRFRTTTTGRTRAPSIGSTRTLRSERAEPRLLFTRTASPRTLSLAASLGLPRQRPTGRLELSRAPASRPAVSSTEAPRYDARKMRLTDFCNRLPSRAPCGLPDSRSHPTPRHALRRLAVRLATRER
jgi:hypothetical protein